ncbi:hypothetical protein Tco_1540092 [Tanacetum coccineum]
MSTFTSTISLSSNDTSSSYSLASAIRPLFFTIEALEAKALELRRASLALTLLYLASKSLVSLSSGLGHNLFFIGQFCDSDLDVAFRKHTCFVRNLEGVDLLLGSCGSNLYRISLKDMMKPYPICLLSKASKTKSWLWHCDVLSCRVYFIRVFKF